jgi:large subunit ribosomal protein L3
MIGFAVKKGMTRLFQGEKSVPVTVLYFPKQEVITKTEKAGRIKVQLGAGRKKNVSKAVAGHIAKNRPDLQEYPEFLGEFEVPEQLESYEKGVSVDDFQVGSKLKATSRVIGRGYTGVIKKYNFGGKPATHGHEHKRDRGSIGGMFPQRVLPGTKMAGRYGGQRKTVRGAEVVEIDSENGLLFVKGSVAGANQSVVRLQVLS